MSKPAALLRANRDADALIAKMTPAPGQVPPQEGGAPPLALVPDNSVPPANLAPSEGQFESFEPSGQQDSPYGQTPAFLAGGDGGAAPPDAGGTPAGDDSSYEHRFKVLQGKYNAETRRLRDDNQSLTGRLTNLEMLLGRMAAPAPTPAPPAPPPPSFDVRPLADSEVDEFGGDMLDAAARFTMQRVAPVITALERQVADLTTRLAATSATADTAATTVATSKREQLFAYLDTHASDWRMVNVDEGFKSWLSEEDAMSGMTRHALLTAAYERNEGPRVLRFFQAYKAETSAGAEPVAGRQDNPANPVPRVNPAALVAPGRGRNIAPATPAPTFIWTPASIAAFYADVRAGVFKTNPSERDRLEQDIFLAQREGRVQPQ
jgi:hypothetical protein